MGRTACTEPQCLYKGDLYPYLSPTSPVMPHSDLLIQNWRPDQACVQYKHYVLLMLCDLALYSAAVCALTQRVTGQRWSPLLM